MLHVVFARRLTKLPLHIVAFSTVNNAAQVNQQSSSIVMTEKCIQRLKELHQKSPEKTLRISVEGGGCSGFQYLFNLDTNVNEDDWSVHCRTNKGNQNHFLPFNSVVERDGAKIIVDNDSMQYLEGATIDFQSELIRSAFHVLKNPKAESGCSCGSSFSLKVT